jgi:hypothetical protein
MNFETFYILAIAGAVGALVDDILKDNCLELPKLKEGQFYLGFIGSLCIGAVAGYYIDGGIITAFMGGFVGKSIIKNLAKSKINDVLKSAEKKTIISPIEVITNPKNKLELEQMIRTTAISYDVDPNLAVKVAKCESNLEVNAVNKNKNGTTDRGIYQWNDYYHPDITDKMAFDPQIATNKFCEAVKNGNLSWWNASKKCWNV